MPRLFRSPGEGFSPQSAPPDHFPTENPIAFAGTLHLASEDMELMAENQNLHSLASSGWRARARRNGRSAHLSSTSWSRATPTVS
jgi:hypothetical protein